MPDPPVYSMIEFEWRNKLLLEMSSMNSRLSRWWWTCSKPRGHWLWVQNPSCLNEKENGASILFAKQLESNTQ